MKKLFTLMTLLLCAVGVNATITAKWDFQHDYAANDFDFNGTTGTVTAKSGEAVVLMVNASSGRLLARGSDVMMNANTKIQVPVVSTNDIVTVVSYPGYHYYKIAGTAADADTEIYNVQKTDVDQGYVEILATNQSYLYSIEVESAYMPSSPITATWDFVNDCAGLDGGSTSSLTPISSDDANIKLTVEYNSKSIRDNGDSYQTGEGVVLKVPVGSTSDQLTFVYHSETYGKYTYGSGNIESSGNDDTYSPTATDVENGYVAIVSSTAGNSYLKSIKLTKKSFVTATVSSIGWSTFCTNNILDFTNVAGLKSYIITGANTSNVISMSQVTGSVVGGTGLLLNGTAGASYNIPIANTSTFDVTANKLVGYALENTGTHTVSAAESGYTHYVLVASGVNAVFKYIGETSATINPGQAYLRFANSDIVSGAREFTLDGGVTGISEMENVRSQKDDIYYDLNGRRVLYPTKGLYIVNGKKVVMK